MKLYEIGLEFETDGLPDGIRATKHSLDIHIDSESGEGARALALDYCRNKRFLNPKILKVVHIVPYCFSHATSV